MPHDAAYAIRQLRKSPVFASAAILTLALGIGANAAIYQVLDALIFRSLPVREPARLVSVRLLDDGKPRNFSYPEYRDFEARQRVTEGMLASNDYPLHAAILRGRGQARPVNTAIVTPGYFHVLGVEARLGRVLDDADDRAPVAVISDAFWEREFGRARDAIGQTLHINKSVLTVIGVAPPRFSGETPGNAPDVWAPMGLTPQLLASDWLNAPKSWLTVMARLRPGVSLATAREAMETAYREAGHPAGRVLLEPGGRGNGGLRTRFEEPALVLMAAVGLLLLMGCCNLATLLLGRAMARSHEIAVRLALGAGRGRIVRQLLAEGIVLAAAGGALGLAVAQWGAHALAAQAAPLARIPMEWNWRVMAFTGGVTALATVLFGLAPAFSATRPASHRGRDRAGRAFGRPMIVAQISVSLLLLSGAGLLAQSLWNLRHQDFGFRADRLVAAELPWEFNPAMMARYAAISGPLFDRLNALPGVESAALSGFGPMGGAQHTGPLSAAGSLPAGVRIVHVSPRYFETTGIPIVAGRRITDADRAGGRKVAVLSQTAALMLFGGDGAVGRLVSQLENFDAERAIEVIGVARDVRFATPGEPFSAVMFVPLTQFPAPITSTLARATGDPAGVAAGIRGAIRSVDPDLAVGSVRTVTEIVDGLLGEQRMLALLATCFGLLALALTCVGVYGAIAYAVERRTHEIGIRVALGARRSQVTALLVGEVAATAGAGVILGAAGTVGAARAMRNVLFGVAPDSYAALACAALLLGAVAATAAYLPARRAARLDPTGALRQE